MTKTAKTGIFALSLILGILAVQPAAARAGGAGSASGSLPVTVELATASLLHRYVLYTLFVEDDRISQRIMFRAKTAVNGFNWIAVGYTEDDMRPYAKAVLHSAGNFSPEHPFVAAWTDAGTFPHRGISYIDENGRRRYFTLSENMAEEGEGGSEKFILKEFQDKNTFTDERDGKTYKIVTIGKQTWMAENLHHDIGINYCYDRPGFNCDRYGRLYSWGTAQYACPDGWRLPGRDDWSELVEAVKIRERHDEAERRQKARGPAFAFYNIAGTVLKSKTDWQQYEGDDKKIPRGTDDFGFAALPAGSLDKDGSYSGQGQRASWWADSEHGEWTGFLMQMNYENEYFVESYANKAERRSVRCVQKSRTPVKKPELQLNRGAIPEGLEAMIAAIVKALQGRDEAAINRLLHRDFGIVLLARPCAYHLVTVREKIAFADPPSGFSVMPLGAASVTDYRVSFEALPAFDCDDKWKWNKTSGIYAHSYVPGASYPSPVSIAKGLIEAELTELSASEFKKLEALESKSTHYRVRVLGKTGAVSDFLDFTLTLIDGRWYLTIVDMADACS